LKIRRHASLTRTLETFAACSETGDRDRDGDWESREERRIVRVIAAFIIVAMIVTPVPITAAVAPMCVVPMASVIASMIISVSSGVNGAVTGVDGSRVG
jgi:hypothetical protein